MLFLLFPSFLGFEEEYYSYYGSVPSKMWYVQPTRFALAVALTPALRKDAINPGFQLSNRLEKPRPRGHQQTRQGDSPRIQ